MPYTEDVFSCHLGTFDINIYIDTIILNVAINQDHKQELHLKNNKKRIYVEKFLCDKIINYIHPPRKDIIFYKAMSCHG